MSVDRQVCAPDCRDSRRVVPRSRSATLLALTTALLYAISNVLELLEAEKVPDEYAMRPALMVRLVKRPRWLLGLLSDFGGYITHAAALGLATVVFVEPMLATGILMSLFIGSAFVHRRVHARRLDRGRVVLSGGLALFLYEVSPTGGRRSAGLARVADRRTECGRRHRCLHGRSAGATPAGRARALLGVAAGITFGVSALLTKALVHYLGDGIFAWVPHWEPYALAVAAIGGVIVAQSALQTGALGAAVGSIESMSVISGSLFGLFLLDEHVGAHTAFQICAVVVSIARDPRRDRQARRTPRSG